MILLKRLNGTPFYVNAELIEQIESAPDTVITLTTGNNLVVRDSLSDVIEKILSYRQHVNRPAVPSKASKPVAALSRRG